MLRSYLYTVALVSLLLCVFILIETYPVLGIVVAGIILFQLLWLMVHTFIRLWMWE